MEIWKDVVGYEGLYMVSSLGRVKNGRTEVVLKPSKQNSGYLKVNLHSNGRQETKTVHRIVASSFLGMGEECGIHHLDADKTNNSLSNLGACPHQRNVELSKARHIHVVSPEGVHQDVFGIRRFCRDNDLNHRSIIRVCKGELTNHKGWRATYV